MSVASKIEFSTGTGIYAVCSRGRRGRVRLAVSRVGCATAETRRHPFHCPREINERWPLRRTLNLSFYGCPFREFNLSGERPTAKLFIGNDGDFARAILTTKAL
jgi:hypothetical protein